MHQHLTSIVAIDKRGAIGCKNRLPWLLKSDMAFFRKTTLGHTVIMGRKTYDSIGGGLNGRHNLVLSHNYNLFAASDSCRLVHSSDEALADAGAAGHAETFVIGGAATYLEFSGLVDRYLVTMIDHLVADADAFLATTILSQFDAWACEEVGVFPAVAGKDEFAFRIVAFTAPDAPERRARRQAIAERHLGKRCNVAVPRARPKPSSMQAFQPTFSF